MDDLIKRADAMGAVQDHFNADGFKGYDDGQKMMDRIKALPSADAEQVTNKLKNPCDSLLKSDSDECKEQKSKLESADVNQTNGKLIDADALMDLLKARKQFFVDAYGGSFHCMSEKDKARCDEIDACIASIVNAPTASAEAVQGEWKCMADCGVTECDQCGWIIEEYVGDYNYCPNCGARMKGGDDE